MAVDLYRADILMLVSIDLDYDARSYWVGKRQNAVLNHVDN